MKEKIKKMLEDALPLVDFDSDFFRFFRRHYDTDDAVRRIQYQVGGY